MRRVIVGTKNNNIDYDFRETCFGIVFNNNLFYLTEKNGKASLIGGGIEKGENPLVCLEREFMEEAGLTISNIHEFVTIDCFWITKNNKYMNSLSNFYIVEVEIKEVDPLEEGHKLIKVSKDEILDLIVLPYQRNAIELYFDEVINK